MVSNYINSELNYKDCPITSIRIGFNNDPKKYESDMKYILDSYPSINIKGIKLGDSQETIKNKFGDPQNKYESSYIELMYDNDFQVINFYLYNDKLYKVNIRNTSKCYE